MQQRERDTFLKRALDDIYWICNKPASDFMAPFPLVSPLLHTEEPWKHCQQHVTTGEKVRLVNINPKLMFHSFHFHYCLEFVLLKLPQVLIAVRHLTPGPDCKTALHVNIQGTQLLVSGAKCHYPGLQRHPE